MKILTSFNAAFLALLTFVGLNAFSVHAQTYETSLTNTELTENFDELSVSSIATLPTGWIFAQGVGMPTYGSELNCQSPPFRFTTNAPINCQDCTRDYDGGSSGGTGNSASPTGGARVNWGDITASDRSVGFMSLNSSSSTDYRSPTNYIMFGFYNNTGSNIVSIDVTNNVKLYRQNTTAATVTFFYSYDGTNWTHVSTGDVGPFPSGTSTYYFSSPITSNVSFTISSLNVSNGAPFYLAWQFIIANSSGSFSEGLGLDDIGLALTLGAPVTIKDSVWNAGAGNWSTANNWVGNSLPGSGDNLYFTGTGGSTTNDLSSITTGNGIISSLTFSNTAGSYTLEGNAITLGAGITNNSAVKQTINLPVTLNMDESFVAASGDLVFGSITNGGYAVNFLGSSNITLNGTITGGGGMTMSSTGTLLVNSDNDFSGSLSVSAGTLKLGNSERLPNSSIISIGSDATFDLNNFNETLASIAGSGSINLGSGTLTIGSISGSSTFSGTISGNGSLIKTGDFMQTISGTNSYHGGTWLMSGILAISSSAVIGDGPLVLDGGTLQLTGTRSTTTGILVNDLVLGGNTIIQNTTTATSGTRNLPFSGAVIATNGMLTIQNIATGNYTNVMHVRFYGNVTNFTQDIVFDNSLAGSQDNNTCLLGAYNTNGSAPQLYSGTISGPGAFYRGANTGGTGGTAILTGNNTFTLGTTIDRGYLGLGSDTISSDGTVVSGPVGTGTLQINDDTIDGTAGVGLFAYGGPRTIENRVLLNGTTNAIIGGTNDLTLAGLFDTGASVPKMITISNTAITTISGQFDNNADFAKSGPGVLVLTADNGELWAGAFSILDGVVVANNTIGSAAGTNALTISGGLLKGNGFIGCPTVVTGGGIAPGNTVGILTFASNVDFSGGGSLVWNLSANSTNNPGTDFSQIALTGGTLTLGGSSILNLQFTNAATAPNSTDAFWQTAHTWRIATLSGASLNGNFASIGNGTYSVGTFSTSTDAEGVLLTFTPATISAGTPGIASLKLSGGQLTMTITNGTSNGTFYIVTTTNLAEPLANWVPLLTNTYSANGTFTNSLPVNASDRQRFFSIKQP